MASFPTVLRLRTRVTSLVTGCVVLAVAACAPLSAPTPGAARPAPSPAAAPVLATGLGNFLAANLAENTGDLTAATDYYSAALAHDPDNRDLLLHAFTAALAVGQIPRALPLARRLTEMMPQSPLPQMVLAVADARSGKFADAGTRLRHLPAGGAGGILGPLLHAWILAGQHRTDRALAVLKPMERNRTLIALAVFHRGLIEDLANRRPSAEQAYKLAMTDLSNVRTVEALGSLYQRTGHMDAARALYRRYAQTHPDTLLFDPTPLLRAGTAAPPVVTDPSDGIAEALFDMAPVMRQGGDNDAALIFLRLALYARPDFPLAQMMTADILAAQGHLDQAAALYRAIPETAPIHAYSRLRLAIIRDEQGDTDGAMAILDGLAKAHAHNLDLLMTRGDILRRHERYKAAIQDYSAAIAAARPGIQQMWALYFSRGVCYERIGPWAKAEADFLQALRLDPNQPEVLNYLGYSWVDRGLHLRHAEALIREAVRLRPRDGAMLDSLGWAQYRLGQYSQAVTTLERAVELKPDDSTINEHLGDAYWRVGQQVDAHRQWRRAMEENPQPEQVEGLKIRLKTGAPPANENQHF
jgi:tetratricopeptide (TPR) repeat protein